MPRDGSGNYTLPAGNPVVTNTVITSTWANSTLNDIAAALTASLPRDGSAGMTGNLQMGNHKITGVTPGAAAGEAVTFDQANGAYVLKAGDTMTGALNLVISNPTADWQAVPYKWLNDNFPRKGQYDTYLDGNQALATNANLAINPGKYYYNNTSTNFPSGSGIQPFGVLEVVANVYPIGSLTNGTWIVQRATDTGAVPRTFVRTNINNGVWSAWREEIRQTSTGTGFDPVLVIQNNANINKLTIDGYGGGRGYGAYFKNGTAGDNPCIIFANSAGTEVGSIHVGDGSTSYITSSDYRLKKVDGPAGGGLDLVGMMKVYDGEYLVEPGVKRHFVLAHEIQAVLPYAAFGEKDGEAMQGVDYSKLVPVLISAVQELSAKVKALGG